MKSEDRLWLNTPEENEILKVLEKFFKVDKNIYFKRRESTMKANFFKTNPKPSRISDLRKMERGDMLSLAYHLHASGINPMSINLDDKIWVIVNIGSSMLDKGEEKKYRVRYEMISEIIKNKDGVFVKTPNSGNAVWQYDKTAFFNKTTAQKMAAFYELTGEEVPHINFFRRKRADKTAEKHYEFSEDYT